ncbi:MAG: hypothetical protein WBP55_10055 [Solirubrobacterales bacterium]
MSDTETWEVWTKQPGDANWLKVAMARRVLPWTASLAILILCAPGAYLAFSSDVPSRVRYGITAVYVVGLFALAAASDRAVQLERRRVREGSD